MISSDAMTLDQPLTVPQVAALYEVTRATVYTWIKSGRLAPTERDDRERYRFTVTWEQLRRFDRTLPAHKRAALKPKQYPRLRQALGEGGLRVGAEREGHVVEVVLGRTMITVSGRDFQEDIAVVGRPCTEQARHIELAVLPLPWGRFSNLDRCYSVGGVLPPRAAPSLERPTEASPKFHSEVTCTLWLWINAPHVGEASASKAGRRVAARGAKDSPARIVRDSRGREPSRQPPRLGEHERFEPGEDNVALHKWVPTAITINIPARDLVIESRGVWRGIVIKLAVDDKLSLQARAALHVPPVRRGSRSWDWRRVTPNNRQKCLRHWSWGRIGLGSGNEAPGNQPGHPGAQSNDEGQRCGAERLHVLPVRDESHRPAARQGQYTDSPTTSSRKERSDAGYNVDYGTTSPNRACYATGHTGRTPTPRRRLRADHGYAAGSRLGAGARDGGAPTGDPAAGRSGRNSSREPGKHSPYGRRENCHGSALNKTLDTRNSLSTMVSTNRTAPRGATNSTTGPKQPRRLYHSMTTSTDFTTPAQPYAPSYRTNRLPSARHRSALSAEKRWNVEAAANRMRALSDDELALAVADPRLSPHVTGVYAHEAAQLVMRERVGSDEARDRRDYADTQALLANMRTWSDDAIARACEDWLNTNIRITARTVARERVQADMVRDLEQMAVAS